MIGFKEVVILLIGTVIGILLDTFLGMPLRHFVGGDWSKNRRAKKLKKIRDEILQELKTSKGAGIEKYWSINQ